MGFNFSGSGGSTRLFDFSRPMWQDNSTEIPYDTTPTHEPLPPERRFPQPNTPSIPSAISQPSSMADFRKIEDTTPLPVTQPAISKPNLLSDIGNTLSEFGKGFWQGGIRSAAEGYKADGENTLYALQQETAAREKRLGLTPTVTGKSFLNPLASSVDIGNQLSNLQSQTPYQPTTLSGKIGSFAGGIIGNAPEFSLGGAAMEPAAEKVLGVLAPKVAPKLLPYAERAVRDSLSFAPIGLIDSNRLQDIPGNVATSALTGAVLGPALHGVGEGLRTGIDYAKFNNLTKLPIQESNPLQDVQSAYKSSPILRDVKAQQYNDLFNSDTSPLKTELQPNIGPTLRNQGLTDAELLQQKINDAQGAFGGPLNNYKLKQTITPEQKAYDLKNAELNNTFKDLPIGSVDTPLATNTLQQNIDNSILNDTLSSRNINQRQSELQKTFNSLPNQGKYYFTTGEQRALNELQNGIQTAQNYIGHTDVLAGYPPGTTIEQAYADIANNTGVDLPKLMANWEKAQGVKTSLTSQELSMGRSAGVIPTLKPRELTPSTSLPIDTLPIEPAQRLGLSGNLPVDAPIDAKIRPNVKLKPRELKQAGPIAEQPTPQRVLPEQPGRLTWTNRDNIPGAGPAPIRSITDQNLSQLPKSESLTSPAKITPNEPVVAPIGEPKINTETPAIDPVNAKMPDASAHPVAEHILNKLDDIEASARARIVANRGRLNAGLPIDTMVDYGIIGATKIARGTVKYSVWAADMANDLGNSIKPYLKDIWEESNKQHSLMVDGTFNHALPEPQSKIIIGKEKEPFSFKNAWDKFYTGIVDSQKPIGDFSKVAGDDTSKLASNTKNVGGIVDFNLLKGLVDKNGDKVGDSLKSVVEAIPKGQEKEFWTYMSQLHNIDRAREGKPVQANYTPGMSADAVKIAEQKHPEYKAIGDNIANWIDKFMQTWGVDTGIVNKDIYKGLRETYKSYFPTQRDFSSLEQSIPDNVSQKFADQRTPIRKATGSERDIIDPVENIMRLVDRTVRTAKYNEVGQSLLDAVRENPVKMKQFAEVIPTKEGMFTNLDNVITVLENGKPTYLKINNKSLLDAMNGLPKAIRSIPVLSTLTNGFKGLITQKNPIFAIRNIFRDVPTAYVFGSESNPFKFGAGLIGAGKDILTNSPRLQKYQAVGGGGANFFSSGDVTKSAAELMGKRPSIGEVIKHPIKTIGESKPIQAIEKFNNMVESAPRLAEFNRVLDKTGDVTKALHAANDVTVNFSRGGNITKNVDKVTPYLNAGVQGLDKFVRSFVNPKTAVSSLVKSGVAITTPTLALYLVNKDNPNYQALDNRTKDNYYVIPKPDGTFFKIPKSRELGVLFSSLFERGIRAYEGQEDSFKGLANTALTNFAPANPVDSNFFSPATWNLATNKDFANRTIVPQSMIMDKRSPYLQYDDKTSSIAKSIGELSKNIPGLPGGLSPKQIDYLIKSYTGVIGQIGIPLTVPGGSPGKALSTQFTADPAFSNQATTDFYDKLDKLSSAATDKNIIQKIPSKTLTPEENMRNSMNGISSAINRGTKLVNSLQVSSDPLKDSKIKAIKTQMLNLENKAVSANNPGSMQLVENAAKKLWNK